MMKNKELIRHRVDLFLNLVIVLTTAGAVLSYFIGGPDVLGSQGVMCFRYFTTDSNILAAVASLLWLIFRLSGRKVPAWITVLKFTGTVAVSITFLVVVFFLAPMGVLGGGGFQTVLMYFSGAVFVLHFTTPVLSFISTVLLEKEPALSRLQAAWGVVPTVVYGVVYLVMVVFVKRWTDWYGFTFGGHNEVIPAVMTVMLAFSLGLSLLERRIRKREDRK